MDRDTKQAPDSGPDFIRDAFGDNGGPVEQPADGVLLAALLAIETAYPHPGVYAFVQGATGVALDMGFDLNTTVRFVRQVRRLHEELLAESPERQLQLAPEFARQFVEALMNELPADGNAHGMLDMAMLRYEHVMRASAVALTAAEASGNGAPGTAAAETAKGG